MKKSFLNEPRASTALEPRWQRFLSHRRTLERMILRTLRSRQDAADMLQEIALVLARRVEVPDDDLAFVAWCRAVARHLLMHHFRDARRRPELLLPFDAPTFQRVRDPSSSAERVVALRELLHGATRSIGESAGELLTLRYVDEENSSEIGTRLDEPAVSIRMRLSRLRAHLRKQLIEYEATPSQSTDTEPTTNNGASHSETKHDSDVPPPSTVRLSNWAAQVSPAQGTLRRDRRR